MLEILINL